MREHARRGFLLSGRSLVSMIASAFYGGPRLPAADVFSNVFPRARDGRPTLVERDADGTPCGARGARLPAARFEKRRAALAGLARLCGSQTVHTSVQRYTRVRVPRWRAGACGLFYEPHSGRARLGRGRLKQRSQRAGGHRLCANTAPDRLRPAVSLVWGLNARGGSYGETGGLRSDAFASFAVRFSCKAGGPPRLGGGASMGRASRFSW